MRLILLAHFATVIALRRGSGEYKMAEQGTFQTNRHPAQAHLFLGRISSMYSSIHGNCEKNVHKQSVRSPARRETKSIRGALTCSMTLALTLRCTEDLTWLLLEISSLSKRLNIARLLTRCTGGALLKFRSWIFRFAKLSAGCDGHAPAQN